MGLLSLLVFLIIVGVVLYLLNAVVPMAPPVKTVINVLACLFVFLYVLQSFGLIHLNLHL